MKRSFILNRKAREQKDARFKRPVEYRFFFCERCDEEYYLPYYTKTCIVCDYTNLTLIQKDM
jgi:hypothetical protein